VTHTVRQHAVVTLALLLALPEPARAYLKVSVQTLRAGTVTLRWDASRPVRYFVTNRGVPGVSASDFQAPLPRPFDTWEAVPTASMRFHFADFTNAEAFEHHDLSLLGSQNKPELERELDAPGFL